METRIGGGVREMGLSDQEAGIRTPLTWNSIRPVGTSALALTLGLLLLTVVVSPAAGAVGA